MAENAAKSGAEGWDDEAVAKAHAIYTPSTLSIYDVLVHGLSNHVAWRCPTRKLLELYRANLSANHLEAGVGPAISSTARVDLISSALFCSTSTGTASHAPSGGSRASSRSSARPICLRRSTSTWRHSRRSDSPTCCIACLAG
jgi:hypothetical protein